MASLLFSLDCFFSEVLEACVKLLRSLIRDFCNNIIYLSICLPTYLPIYISSCCSQLEYRASVKRFYSLQFLNLRQSVGLLGGGSAIRKTATCAGQHRRRINAYSHALSGVRNHDHIV
jgi:hypothetical protein